MEDREAVREEDLEEGPGAVREEDREEDLHHRHRQEDRDRHHPHQEDRDHHRRHRIIIQVKAFLEQLWVRQLEVQLQIR